MNDRYAVIGNPMGEAKSPPIHAMSAEAKRQAFECAALLGPTEPSDVRTDRAPLAGAVNGLTKDLHDEHARTPCGPSESRPVRRRLHERQGIETLAA